MSSAKKFVTKDMVRQANGYTTQQYTRQECSRGHYSTFLQRVVYTPYLAEDELNAIWKRSRERRVKA